MTRTIIVQAEEQVACPKCSRRFPLCEGLSRQAIERHAGEFDRAVAEGRKTLEARLAGEAKAQIDKQAKALHEALIAQASTLVRFSQQERVIIRMPRVLNGAKSSQHPENQRNRDPDR